MVDASRHQTERWKALADAKVSGLRLSLILPPLPLAEWQKSLSGAFFSGQGPSSLNDFSKYV
jgi:hypothetical protein